MKYEIIKGINPFDTLQSFITMDLQHIHDLPDFKAFMERSYAKTPWQTPLIKTHKNKLIIGSHDDMATTYLIDAYLGDKQPDNEQFKGLLRKDYIDATGWTTRLILAEIEKRNIPWSILGYNDHPLYLRDSEGFTFYYFVLGYGKNQKRIQQTITDSTSDHAVQMATNKSTCKQLLRYLDIPTPRWQMIENPHDLEEFVKTVEGSPIVLKPNEGGGGVDCYVALTKQHERVVAYEKCQANHATVLAEEFIAGTDVRLCVIDHRVICGLSRIPPTITGDGHSPISELITRLEEKNQQNPACRSDVLIDDETHRILHERGHTLHSVLPLGETLALQYKSNISSGAMVRDITHSLGTEIVYFAEKICRYLQLNIAAVDCIITEDGKPYVIEVNACPGLDNHMFPNEGASYNFAKIIADGLFQEGAPFRVPLLYINDPHYLFGPFQSKNYSDTLKKVQDPGLDYLVFHVEEFWDKGLPVHAIDMLIFFNVNNAELLKHIDRDTLIVFKDQQLLQNFKKRRLLHNFQSLFFIDQNRVMDENLTTLLEINDLTDLRLLIPNERLSQYAQQSSIMIPEELSHAKA